jgi:hypothetical protein
MKKKKRKEIIDRYLPAKEIPKSELILLLTWKNKIKEGALMKEKNLHICKCYEFNLFGHYNIWLNF